MATLPRQPLRRA